MLAKRHLMGVGLLLLSFAGARAGNHFDHSIKRMEKLAIPIFSHPTDSAAVTRINRFLQIQMLHLVVGKERKHIFEEVCIPEKQQSNGFYIIKPTITNNSSSCLSIRFELQYIWASVAYWWDYFNFNPGNGETFQLADLFTEEGYAEFSRKATNRRVAQLRSQIDNDQWEGDGPFAGVVGRIKEDNHKHFYIQGDEIYIDSENCFVKSEKFYIDRTVTRYKLEEFQDQLNGYGRRVFGLAGDNIAGYHSRRLPQLYKGMIAGKEVTLVLSQAYNGKVFGYYVYDQYGKAIELQGEWKGKTLKLNEFLEDGMEVNGTWEAQFDGRSMVGTWKNTNRTHALALSISA